MVAEKNRYDSKWAHPESSAQGWYTMDGRLPDLFTLSKLTREQLEVASNPFKEMLGGMFAAPDENPMLSGANWTTYEAPGCPLEPDAPAVRVLAGIPKDVRPDERLPLFFNFSGGILPSGPQCAEMYITMTRPLLLQACDRFVEVAFDELRGTPAYGYPDSINDAHAAWQFVVEHADELHVDLDRVVWTGSSNTGHAALCLAFRLKDMDWCGAPMPRGMVLSVPVIDDTAYSDSALVDFANPATGVHDAWDGPCVRLSLGLWLGERFGDPTLPPEAVPARATVEDCAGMPPLWIPSEAEFDPCRDSVYELAKKFHAAGTFCDLHVWGGTTHQAFSATEGELAARFNAVTVGAYRDALAYDFRRSFR